MIHRYHSYCVVGYPEMELKNELNKELNKYTSRIQVKLWEISKRYLPVVTKGKVPVDNLLQLLYFSIFHYRFFREILHIPHNIATRYYLVEYFKSQ